MLHNYRAAMHHCQWETVHNFLWYKVRSSPWNIYNIFSRYEQQCRTVTEQQWSIVTQQLCTTVNEQQCSTTSSQSCITQPQQSCSTTYQTVCDGASGGSGVINGSSSSGNRFDSRSVMNTNSFGIAAIVLVHAAVPTALYMVVTTEENRSLIYLATTGAPHGAPAEMDKDLFQ